MSDLSLSLPPDILVLSCQSPKSAICGIDEVTISVLTLEFLSHVASICSLTLRIPFQQLSHRPQTRPNSLNRVRDRPQSRSDIDRTSSASPVSPRFPPFRLRSFLSSLLLLSCWFPPSSLLLLLWLLLSLTLCL